MAALRDRASATAEAGGWMLGAGRAVVASARRQDFADGGDGARGLGHEQETLEDAPAPPRAGPKHVMPQEVASAAQGGVYEGALRSFDWTQHRSRNVRREGAVQPARRRRLGVGAGARIADWGEQKHSRGPGVSGAWRRGMRSYRGSNGPAGSATPPAASSIWAWARSCSWPLSI